MTETINGSINQAGQATLPIAVMNTESQQFMGFNPIMDTGFNGDLQLPIDDITRLNLTAVDTVETILADGQVVDADVYTATALWLGNPRTISIIAAQTIPLIGANLLWHTSMTINWDYGGSVAITTL